MPSTDAITSNLQNMTISSADSTRVATTKTNGKKYFRINLGEVTVNNVKQLKVIHQHTMPFVTLTDNDLKFASITNHDEFIQLGYFNDIPVSVIIARKESVSEASAGGSKNVEILGLGTLKAYRQLGLASQLLEYIITTAKADTSISQIKVRVPSSMIESIKFFEKRGFAASTHAVTEDSVVELVMTLQQPNQDSSKHHS